MPLFSTTTRYYIRKQESYLFSNKWRHYSQSYKWKEYFCYILQIVGNHASRIPSVAVLQVRDFPSVSGKEVSQVGVQDMPGEADHQARVLQVGHLCHSI